MLIRIHPATWARLGHGRILYSSMALRNVKGYGERFGGLPGPFAIPTHRAATLERSMKLFTLGLILVGSSLLAAPPSPLLDTLTSELERNFSVLKEKAD